MITALEGNIKVMEGKFAAVKGDIKMVDKNLTK
jgi:transcription antitermination factor NusG